MWHVYRRLSYLSKTILDFSKSKSSSETYRHTIYLIEIPVSLQGKGKGQTVKGKSDTHKYSNRNGLYFTLHDFGLRATHARKLLPTALSIGFCAIETQTTREHNSVGLKSN
jgi:hypothetical protein